MTIFGAPHFSCSKTPFENSVFPAGAPFFLKFVRENNKTDILNNVGFCFSLPYPIFAAVPLS